MLNPAQSRRRDLSLLRHPCPVHRLLDAQAAEHGVEVESLPAVEGKKAASVDSRSGEQDVVTMAGWHEVAQRAFFRPNQAPLHVEAPHILLGPNSKVVDHIISAAGLQRLVAEIVRQEGEETFQKALGEGPGNGDITWSHAQTPLELIAGILRWGTLRGQEKCRVRATDEVRSWVVDRLRALGEDTKPRLGGVSAVGTRLCQVLGARPTMIALGKLSPDIAAHLPADTVVVGSAPEHHQLSELPRASYAAPNLSFQHKGAPLQLPLTASTVGPDATRLRSLRELDVLVTGQGEIPFAGMDPTRSARLGAAHDAMILTGAHRIRTKMEGMEYFNQVRAIKSNGCAVALVQADARAPEEETEFLRTLLREPLITYWGMNGSEAWKVLTAVATVPHLQVFCAPPYQKRLQQALSLAAQATTVWPSGREQPEWIMESALLLQELFQVPMVRVRGRSIDILATEGGQRIDDPLRIRNHLIISRNLATLKVADLDGLLNHHTDLLPLRNLPDGGCVAAIRKAADALGDLSPEPQRLAERGYLTLNSGQTVFAVPPIQFYDRSGGTQSAGDTIDVSFVAAEAVHSLRSVRHSRP